MNPRRQAKCISWANWYGREKAIHQWMIGDPYFATSEELQADAKQSARLRAEDYERTFDLTIPPEEYLEWEQVYVSKYTASYLQTVQAYQKCRQCGKNDLPTNQQTHLCVRCAIDNEVATEAFWSSQDWKFFKIPID